MSKDTKYEAKAVTTQIKATSRIAIKIRDNYYTIEYSEERSIPTDLPTVDIELERQALWDDVNDIVDSQAEDVIKAFKNKS